MTTTIQQQDGNLVALFEGRLDTAAAVKTEQDMQPLYDCEGKDVILDCSKLEYISSSGLRLFLSLLKVAKPKGSHVIITGLSEDLRQVFAMTGFTNLFDIR
jgi:anti-anti-sigma factor